MVLRLDTGHGDPFREIPLEEDENKESRHKGNRRSRHFNPEVPFLRQQGRQSDRNRVHLFRRHENQRREQIIPAADERERPDRRDGRLRQRQHNAEENREIPRAVDVGRFLQILRDRHHELPYEEYPHNGPQLRNDNRPVRINPAELAEHDILRNNKQLAGHHDDSHHEPEHDLPAGEPLFGENIPEHRPEKNLGRHRDQRDDKRVLNPMQERTLPDNVREIVQRRIRRNPEQRIGRCLLHLLQRTENHHRKRKKEQDAENDEQHINDGLVLQTNIHASPSFGCRRSLRARISNAPLCPARGAVRAISRK